jgi:hypothetical protein
MKKTWVSQKIKWYSNENFGLFEVFRQNNQNYEERKKILSINKRSLSEIINWGIPEFYKWWKL